MIDSTCGVRWRNQWSNDCYCQLPTGHEGDHKDGDDWCMTHSATWRNRRSTADRRAAKANTEIERKFLLTALPPRALDESPALISQGWIPGTTIKERIRETVYDFHRHTCMRAIKVGSGLSRFEFEEPMTLELFNALWPFTTGARIQKRRYKIQEGAQTWEIDDFAQLRAAGQARPLFLAEIELRSADEVVTIPEWLQPYVVREVTDEPEYTNANLAQ